MNICLWVTRRVVSAQIMGCSGNNGECAIKTEMTKTGSKKEKIKDGKTNHLQLAKQKDGFSCRAVSSKCLHHFTKVLQICIKFATPELNSIFFCNVKPLGCQCLLVGACRVTSKCETTHSGVYSRKENKLNCFSAVWPVVLSLCSASPQQSGKEISKTYSKQG